MKFLSWNVNGVRAAVKKGALEQLQALDMDVICLQEIKAKEDQIPAALMEWEGYQPFIFPAQRPGYSGVAVFSRAEPISVSLGMGIDRFDEEGRTIVMEFPDYLLFNAYFPNGGNGPERLQYKMDFYAATLEYAANAAKPLIITGDVNTAHKEIDLARPKENRNHTGFLPMECAWIDQLLEAGFVDSFRLFCDEPQHYTWWDMKTRARERNIGWRIDYFFVDQRLQQRIKSAGILPDVLGSDHCPVVLEMD